MYVFNHPWDVRCKWLETEGMRFNHKTATRHNGWYTNNIQQLQQWWSCSQSVFEVYSVHFLIWQLCLLTFAYCWLLYSWPFNPRLLLHHSCRFYVAIVEVTTCVSSPLGMAYRLLETSARISHVDMHMFCLIPSTLPSAIWSTWLWSTCAWDMTWLVLCGILNRLHL